MAMPFPENLVPDDLLAAVRTIKAAAKEAAPSAGVWLRYLIFYSAFFLIVGTCGFFLQRAGALSAQAAEGWKMVTTLLTIITGFMITTMLFTGKVEAAKSLNSVELEKFTLKSNHLLFSQWLTLINHIVCLTLISLMLSLNEAHPVISYWILPPAVGMLALSFLRSMLVPIQIIELHRFVHAALLREKQDEEGSKKIT